jgi:uncharacterized protein YpuA (DUF1002 family)
MLTRVWNGLSATRKDHSTYRQTPDDADWQAITQQVQETQRHLLAISGADVPETVEQLRAAQQKLDGLLERVEALQVPEDMRAEVNALTERMDRQ